MPNALERHRRNGDKAIRLHGDFDFPENAFPSSDDYVSAAVDIVADILHAVFWSNRPHLSVDEFLDRARQTYESDRDED